MWTRYKSKFDPLIQEMLDKLPVSVWTSKKTTFLDPAMGGGQFVRLIIERLRKYGHSDKNIASRVYGIELEEAAVLAAINKQKLIGTFKFGDFTNEKIFDMKFDVIVGNPPYQHNTKRGIKLWPKFLKFCLPKLASGGYLAFITPNVWAVKDLSLSKNVRTIILDYRLVYLNTDVDKYFNIGENVCSFIIKNSQGQELFELDGIMLPSYSGEIIHLSSENILANSILNKVQNFISNKKDVIGNRWTMTAPKQMGEKYSKEKTKTHTNLVMHTAAQWYWTSEDTSSHQGPKVLINLSGYYKDDEKYILVHNKAVAGGNSRQINYKTMEQARNARTYFASRIYVFVVNYRKSGGFNTVHFLPILDASHPWTDAELYAHFKLTQEEIDLIEATIK